MFRLFIFVNFDAQYSADNSGFAILIWYGKWNLKQYKLFFVRVGVK